LLVIDLLSGILALAATRITVLLTLLAVATWHDVKSRRVPNILVVIGIVLGLALQTIFALRTNTSISDALISSSAGCLAGFVFLLPLYLLRAMGAGDVKLMAMVGSFLGPAATLGATLLTMVAGGLLSLVLAACTRQLGKVLANAWWMICGAAMGVVQSDKQDLAPSSKAQVPYAVAIYLGTVLQLLLQGQEIWQVFS
jgi:prepilin peptidase CpaA